MFSRLSRRRPVVEQQWIVPLPGFQSDVSAFYNSIEAEIQLHELPPMQLHRIPWREGGLLSSSREYLRIMRERIIFDIGAGPFGTWWFFSGRGATVPRGLTWSAVLLALLTLGSFAAIYILAFGWNFGWMVLGATFAAFCVIMITAGRWPGLDETLIHMPCVGVIYEALFRRETYYRQDIRLMWLTAINSIVRTKVQEFTRAGGVEEAPFQEISDPMQPYGMRHMALGLAGSFTADMARLVEKLKRQK